MHRSRGPDDRCRDTADEARLDVGAAAAYVGLRTAKEGPADEIAHTFDQRAYSAAATVSALGRSRSKRASAEASSRAVTITPPAPSAVSRLTTRPCR